jgi:hypothetical protein
MLIIQITPQGVVINNGQDACCNPNAQAHRADAGINDPEIIDLSMIQRVIQQPHQPQQVAAAFQHWVPMHAPQQQPMINHLMPPHQIGAPAWVECHAGVHGQHIHQNGRFGHRHTAPQPPINTGDLATKSLNSWAINASVKLQYEAFKTGKAWWSVSREALPRLLADAKKLDCSASITEPKITSVIKHALSQCNNLHEHQEGARFDKKSTELKHTQIRVKSGEIFELLNTLSQKETDELLKQHGISKQGKLIFGQGNFGKVRTARNLETGTMVAVKKFSARQDGLSPRTLAKSEAANFQRIGRGERFVEGLGAAHLRDKRGLEKSYLFMELLPGINGEKTTKALFAQTPNTTTGQQQLAHTVRRNAKQYCQAVSDLNKRNLYHQDIKLDNFQHHQILQSDGSKMEKIKLVDYGLVTANPRHCNGGAILYRPPEVGTRRYTSIKHDAYSLGVTLLALKHGGELFGRSLSLYLHGRDYPIHIQQTHNPSKPQALSEILMSERLVGNTLDEVIAMLINTNHDIRITAEQALSLPYLSNRG